MDPVRWGSILPLSLTELLSDESAAAAQWFNSDQFVKSLGESLGESWLIKDLRVVASPGRFALTFIDGHNAAPAYLCVHLAGLIDDVLVWLLTQATGQRFAKLILVSSALSKEQETQIKWLNEITPLGFDVYGVELAIWKIDQSDVVLPVITATVDNRGVQREWRPVSPSKIVTSQPVESTVDDFLPLVEFWLMFNSELLKRKSSMIGQKPRAQNWVSYPLDEHFKLVASLDLAVHSCAVGLVISGSKFNEYYEQLLLMRQAIERELGIVPYWEVKQGRGFCRIYVRHFGFDVSEKSHWPALHLWLATMLEQFQSVFELKVNLLTLQDRFSSVRDAGIQQKIHWEAASGL